MIKRQTGSQFQSYFMTRKLKGIFFTNIIKFNLEHDLKVGPLKVNPCAGAAFEISSVQ